MLVKLWIKNCPEPMPVLSVKSLPHALPNKLAATELIQLPPTTIKFFELTELTSESVTKTSPSEVAPPAVVVTCKSPELTYTSGFTIFLGTLASILVGELDGVVDTISYP